MSDDLRDRFPHMKPISGTPALFTLNGCGLSLYGSRDRDAATGTYIKTHVITLVFLPILAIGAYRVADAENGGWYFIGKEPLSGLAKGWSALVVSCVLGFFVNIAWDNHLKSPEYRAGQTMAEAVAAEEQQDYAKAARLALDTIKLHTPNSKDARALFQESVGHLLSSNQPKDGIAALNLINSFPSKQGKSGEMFPQLHETVITKLAAWSATQPSEALKYWEAAVKVFPKDTALAQQRTSLIESWHAAEPDNVEAAVALAVIKEEAGDFEAITPLLLPYKKSLGATEGARMLGQNLSAMGQYEEAHDLLYPYVKDKLAAMSNLEERLDKYTEQRWDYWINYLDEGKAPEKFYRDYDKASEEGQNELLNTFIWTRIEKEKLYISLVDKYRNSVDIVPVALDLGIVHLNRAQAFTDPEQRDAELTRAENTFLAIRSVAGETDEYKLFLGQVKYWLGKKSEGKPLFEEVLANNPDNVQLAINLSDTLRQLGDWEWARVIVEEAYANTSNKEDKMLAANQRAFLQKDNDDRIVWLERSDQTDPLVQIQLNSTKGRMALDDGDKTAAKQYLEKAASVLKEKPVSSYRNNNLALIYFDLYEATDDMSNYHEGVELMKEAIRLEPGDAILLSNVIDTLYNAAMLEVAAKKYDLKDIRGIGSTDYFSYLYNDQTGKDTVTAQWNTLSDVQSALAYSEKYMLMAPESLGMYSRCAKLFYRCNAAPLMVRLQKKLSEVELDMNSMKRNSDDFRQGVNDDDYLTMTLANIADIEKRLKTVDAKTQPKAYAYLQVNLVDEQIDLFTLDRNPPASTLIAKAEEGWKLDPTSASRSTYKNALMLGIHESLAKQSPNYAKMAKAMQHDVQVSYLICWVLNDGAEADAKLARESEYFPRLLELYEESLTAFPTTQVSDDWAFFHRVDPAKADQIASSYPKEELLVAMYEIYATISPFNENIVLVHYWRLQMLGQSQEAMALLATARSNGLNLPQ